MIAASIREPGITLSRPHLHGAHHAIRGARLLLLVRHHRDQEGQLCARVWMDTFMGVVRVVGIGRALMSIGCSDTAAITRDGSRRSPHQASAPRPPPAPPWNQCRRCGCPWTTPRSRRTGTCDRNKGDVMIVVVVEG